MTKDEIPAPRVNEEAEHILLPDELDLTNVEDVVSALAPELKPARWARDELVLSLLSMVMGAGWAATLLPRDPTTAVFVFLVLLAPGGFAWVRGTRRVREYRRKVSGDRGALFAEIASKFKRDIEDHRRKVLGPDSEWGRARAPLLEAKDQANRSGAYWRGRVEEDATNEAAVVQLRSAEELEAKFTAALAELDHRSEALLRFFNECETKLPVLERYRRDHEESLALEKLQQRADSAVADAHSALALIGQQFVTEALRMGQALGALERYELKESAGDVPLGRIEHVADQIISSSRTERETLAVLMEEMESTPNTP